MFVAYVCAMWLWCAGGLCVRVVCLGGGFMELDLCVSSVFMCVQLVRPVQAVCGACCALFVCGPEPHLVVGWATVACKSTRLPTGKQQCGKIG